MTRNEFNCIIYHLYSLRGKRNSCTFLQFKSFSEKIININGNIKIIHVAGTNGKGSVCAMLESVYRANGYRVGLFTSPHLIDIRERIQINRSCISIEDFCRLYSEITRTSSSYGIQLSFFQYLTLIALKYFQEKQVDIIILECGIGGRLDSTNIVDADACIITSIARDHEEILGDSLEKIAREKVGIIKKNGNLFIHNTLPVEVRRVIVQYCKQQQATVYYVNTNNAITTNLLGDFQKRNCALVVAVVYTLSFILPVSDKNIHFGLKHVIWPARNQHIILRNGNDVIFDGGHNTAAADAQEQYVCRIFNDVQSCLLFSSTKQKHGEDMLKIYMPYFSEILLVNISDQYKKQPDAFFKCLGKKYQPKCSFVSISDAVAALCSCTKKKFFITGSLYFVGELVQALIAANQLDKKCFSYSRNDYLST